MSGQRAGVSISWTKKDDGSHETNLIPGHGTYSVSKVSGAHGYHASFKPHDSTDWHDVTHSPRDTAADAVNAARAHFKKKSGVHKGPFDDYVSVPARGTLTGEVSRTGYTHEVKVPDVLQKPRTQSQSPRTEGGFNPRTKAPETRLVVDNRPADTRTVGPAPKMQSTMKHPKSTTVAQKAIDPAEYEFKRLTEKMKRRAQGGGKRSAARSRIAAFGKGGEAYLPRPKTPWATPRETMSRMSYGSRKKKWLQRHKDGIKDLGTVTLTAEKKEKSLRVMSIADYHNEVMKADKAAVGPAAPGSATGTPKKFPRKVKPIEKMKPVSDQEALANLKAGTAKSLIMLNAIKALVTGYGKVSGGGALRAANRGPLTINRTTKACACDDSFEEPTLKKKVKPAATKSVDAERDVVVHKSEGDAPMAKTDFNDLFKSELGPVANEDHLVDCPHCNAAITKSDLAKAASVAKQNAAGKTMHGGDGRGQVSSKRGVPGAQKTDAVAGVQNGKGSTKKSDVESEGGDIQADEQPVKKSLGPTVRGTGFVQYIDYGDAPGSDAYIAKSIAEAQGAIGQQATQPMDLNNDLSRLLV